MALLFGRAKTICAILVEGIMNSSVKFEFGPVVQMSFIRFFLLKALAALSFTRAILLAGIMRNISVKLF